MKFQIKAFDRIVILHFDGKLLATDLEELSVLIREFKQEISQVLMVLDKALLDEPMVVKLGEFVHSWSKDSISIYCVSSLHPFAHAKTLPDILDEIGNSSAERIVQILLKEFELEELNTKKLKAEQKATQNLKEALGEALSLDLKNVDVFTPQQFQVAFSKFKDWCSRTEHQHKFFSSEIVRFEKKLHAKDTGATGQKLTSNELEEAKKKALQVLKGLSK